jgi:hypothetical protein
MNVELHISAIASLCLIREETSVGISKQFFAAVGLSRQVIEIARGGRVTAKNLTMLRSLLEMALKGRAAGIVV